MIISKEINKILQLYSNNNLENYDIISININDRINLLFELMHRVHNKKLNDITNNYKCTYYYKLCEYIIDNFIIIYNNNNILDNIKKKLDNDIIEYKLLFKLCEINKGQILLYKLKNRLINIINKKIIYDMMIHSSLYGSIIIFMYWFEMLNININSLSYELMEKIICNAIINSDDRLYKYLINNVLLVNKTKFINENLIKNMISKLIICPPKYILKKIKILSQIVDLNPYLNYMIITLYNVNTKEKNNINMICELHKYYYKSYNYSELYTIINIFSIYFETIEYVYNLLDNILNNNDKLLLKLIMIICYNYMNFDKEYDINELDKIIYNNSYEIFRTINLDYLIDINNCSIKNDIFKILIKYKLINEYVLIKENLINNKIIYYTRFLSSKNINVIKINKILHYLRMYVKRFKNIKFINNLPNINNTHYHRFNFTPLKYDNIKNILSYNDYFIRYKSFGFIINNIPNYAYPNTNLLHSYQVKAEYIDDLNIYLIYDIDIPNTTIYQRYKLLQDNHQFTNNTNIISNVNTLDELKNIINKDIINMYKFSNLYKEDTKWYPLLLCNIDKNLIKDILSNINNICTNKFKGLILSCYNNYNNYDNCDTKIYPLKHLSINIKYDNEWYDANNNKINNIHLNNLKIKSGIYKCFIDKNLVFKVNNKIFYSKIIDNAETINNLIDYTKYICN